MASPDFPHDQHFHLHSLSFTEAEGLWSSWSSRAQVAFCHPPLSEPRTRAP